MTFADIIDKFLAGSYPVPMMVFIVIVGGIVMALFSKRMLVRLNIATKDDIEQLRGATKTDIEQLKVAAKTDIEQLREEMKHGFQQIKENDLYHTNKAILIMAKHLITDLNAYNRIKDAIIENTPDRLKDDLRII